MYTSELFSQNSWKHPHVLQIHSCEYYDPLWQDEATIGGRNLHRNIQTKSLNIFSYTTWPKQSFVYTSSGKVEQNLLKSRGLQGEVWSKYFKRM